MSRALAATGNGFSENHYVVFVLQGSMQLSLLVLGQEEILVALKDSWQE